MSNESQVEPVRLSASTMQAMGVDEWEDLCEGTCPGYTTHGTALPGELEARAYASLAEVIDEADPRDWGRVMEDRRAWTDANQHHKGYQPDQRISSLARLLLHHGWQPPTHLAYTLIEPTSDAMSPLAEEQLDFGEAMLALAREASSSERGGDEHDAR